MRLIWKFYQRAATEMLSLRTSTIFSRGKEPWERMRNWHLIAFRLASDFEALGSLSLAVTINCRSNYLTSTGVNVMPRSISLLAATMPSVKSK